MADIRFQHIEFLWGLALIPLLILLFFMVLRWKKRTAKKIGDPLLVKDLFKNFSAKKYAVKFILLLLAFAMVVIAAANLQKKGMTDKINRKGVDVMIALDVSKSMLAEDIKPNRLERAKQLVNRLVDKLDNDRLGLVLFAGRAYVQMPLTLDHAAAKMYVQTAGPDVVPTQGTVIGEALRASNMAFNSKERKYKAVVLISDGEDHDPQALKMAETLGKDGVMINTVGIGSPEGTYIIDRATNDIKKDAEGHNIISKLNEDELKKLSGSTHGIYVRLDDPATAADAIVDQLRTIEQKSLTDAAFINYNSLFFWFVIAALVLLLIELFLPETKQLRLT